MKTNKEATVDDEYLSINNIVITGWKETLY